MNKQEDCKKIDGTPITFDSPDSVEFPKKIFEPYNSYNFNFNGIVVNLILLINF